MATRTNKKDSQEDDQVYTFSLRQMGLSAGMMIKDNLINLINTMLPKRGPHVNLSSGQCVSILLLRLLSGALPAGLSKISDQAKTVPINLLSLNTKIDGGHTSINRYVLADVLDRIAEYGPTNFVTDFIAKQINAEEVQVVNMDSTSIHFHGNPQDPEIVEISNKDSKKQGAKLSEEPIAMQYGYSRDNHEELPQVNLLGISAKLKGDARPTMIYGAAFSGNENDISKFKKFCEQDLARLKELFPNLNVIVMDSACANAKTLRACKDLNIDVVTRLNDNLVKDDLNKLGKDKSEMKTIVDPSTGKQVQYQFLGTQELKHKDGEAITLQKCAFSSESLRPQKEKTITKRAEKECEKLQKSLKKLITKPCACEEDAFKSFDTITKNIKFCEVSKPKIELVYGFKGKGRPPKDAQKEIVAVKLFVDVSINQDLVKQAVEKELFYVIARTDLNAPLNDEHALDLYKTYHEQSGIEGCWKDIKATGSFIDSIFLESESRIRSLFALITIALFYQRRLMNKVLKVMEEEKISLSSLEQKATYVTSWTTFVEYMKNNGPKIMIFNGQVAITNLKMNNSFVTRIAESIGEEAVSFYKKITYDQRLDEIIGSYECMLAKMEYFHEVRGV